MRNCTGRLAIAALVAVTFLSACAPPVNYDVILRGGTIYDGSGNPSFSGDVAFDGDMIAAYGDLGRATGTTEIDVSDLAVAPGFVNMMSWANESLIEDGHSQSDIRLSTLDLPLTLLQLTIPELRTEIPLPSCWLEMVLPRIRKS